MNVCGGVPTSIVPYQRSFESSTSGSEPDVAARFVNDEEKRAVPMFLSNAAAPRRNLLNIYSMKKTLNKSDHLRFCVVNISPD